MGRWLNFIYGGLLVVVIVTTWLKVFPPAFLSFIISGLGILILMTHVDDTNAQQIYGQTYAPRTTGFFPKVRRWFFGGYIVLVGLMSFVDFYTDFPWAVRTSIYTFSGQLILLLIGAVYVVAAIPRARNIQISSI